MQERRRILFLVNVDWFFISHRLPWAIEATKRNFEVCIVAKDTGKFRDLEKFGFLLYDLKIKRSGTNPIVEFVLLVKIIKIFIKYKPHVVSNITLKMCFYGSLAAFFARVPKVVNAVSGLGHNFVNNKATQTIILFRLLMRIFFRKKGMDFIFQNPDDLSLFKKMGIEGGNSLHLIKGVGIDLNQYIFSKQKKDEGLCFILTGRMLKDKGIYEFIDASKIISARYPSIKFLLVGDIDPENPASINENDLRNSLNGTKINWLGYRNDIPYLLQNSDVMVLPSYREGLPKSLIEAAASGMPIITTDVPGCRECVDDQVNGFIIPVRNSFALAEKMHIFIQNPTLIELMGKASRKKAEKEFDFEVIKDQIFKIYEKIQ